jgi:hypothetical protein
MPNNFGGPQNHPAYDPRRKLDRATEYLLGDTLYTKVNKTTIESEDVAGSKRRYKLDDPDLPKKVRDRFSKVVRSRSRAAGR